MCIIDSESINQIDNLDGTQMTQTTTLNERNKDETLKTMYTKVVTEPNNSYLKKGYIKCPKCGEQILMIPTLKKMNDAIENHINIHKNQLKDKPIARQHIAIQIRLDLAHQVLHQTNTPQLF